MLNQAGKGQRLSHSVIYGAFSCAHFRALFQKFFHLGMYVKVGRIACEPLAQFA